MKLEQIAIKAQKGNEGNWIKRKNDRRSFDIRTNLELTLEDMTADDWEFDPYLIFQFNTADLRMMYLQMDNACPNTGLGLDIDQFLAFFKPHTRNL